MRIYLLLTILCFNSFSLISQKLALEKASPFTAVQWENDEPVVQFENEWYEFEKLEHFTKRELLDFCKEQYGDKWRRRFSEDLVEVLKDLGYQPNSEVRLLLSKDAITLTVTGIFTYANRQKSYHYNKAKAAARASVNIRQKISIAEALEDISQFEELLHTTSSYAQVASYDYQAALQQLSRVISKETDNVDILRLTYELSKIFSELGDRHSYVRNKSIHTIKPKIYNVSLPFGITILDGQFVATKQSKSAVTCSYYDTLYPYLKCIDGVAIETLVDTYNHRDKKAPQQAKLSRGAKALQDYGALLIKNNLQCPDSITVVFTNGFSEKTKKLELNTANNRYTSKLTQKHYEDIMKMENGNFEGLRTTLTDSIGYLSIPQMYGYNKLTDLEAFVEYIFKYFSNTKALVIDIRNNPGGTRDILQTVAPYIVQPAQSPWVANVAYLRTDEEILRDEDAMLGRYLYGYTSENLTDSDRNAIDTFHIDVQLEHSVDHSRFSKPFYMVLHNGMKVYKQPVYILVNENSFSAATVFASAFKNLPNVKIVGETTDGSSGNAIETHLKNSNTSVKLSTMLSFQRNGKTLDGNGTLPDIHIPADEKQVLEGVDSQLLNLVKRINNKKY